MNDNTNNIPLLRTPLHALHRELGATMTGFAGYEMPLHYPAGVLKENQHTRNHASLFDVSHMGQIRLLGPDAAAALETLVPGDIVDLEPFRQRYSLLTNEQAGILDDIMVTNAGDHLFLVVNAACKKQDTLHLQIHLSARCNVTVINDRAMLALQGPEAHEVMARIAPQATNLAFMNADEMDILGANCLVARCGYTGEDGFEICMSADHAEPLARLLLEQPEVAPAGLGARDTLRLEAGLCLYGQDIDTGTTPVEASLDWAVSRARRPGGARPNGYPGAHIIHQQLLGGLTRKLIGLKVEGRTPVRAGAEIIDGSGQVIGRVTSGAFGPSVNAPIAMGYAQPEFAHQDTRLSAVVRGKKIPVLVTKPPFVPHRYYRG